MAQLVFDEKTLIDGNIFKFEKRLHTHLNKYTESGAILTTYFSQKELDSTVDRGTQDIDELFGKKAPLRYIEIKDYPLYTSNGQLNPSNSDELQIEDIDVTGEFTIIPSKLVPKPLDFFIINHLKMNAIFEVTNVQYDSMKVDGFYKITYRLHSTSNEIIENLRSRVIKKCYTDLNVIGTDMNPIIEEDDFVLRNQIKQMVAQIVQSYRALFYNKRHNCFLYHDPQTGIDYFDMCGNEFMAKHGLVNISNSSEVIVLNNKISDIQLDLYYHNSVYNWIEIGAPERLLWKFSYICSNSEGYPFSSFCRWDENVEIIQPVSIRQAGINVTESFFDDQQLSAFFDKNNEPEGSEYDKLIWKYIHKGSNIDIHDISLYTADVLLSSIKHRDVYLYTPIIVYIINHILDMN